MKLLSYFLAVASLPILVGCDPVHDLKLENQTNKTIDVIYFPTMNRQHVQGREPGRIEINGQAMNLITLQPSEAIVIGQVIARYSPVSSDIHLDYLEVRMNSDTLKLNGRDAIFPALKKVNNLDWRLIISADK